MGLNMARLVVGTAMLGMVILPNKSLSETRSVYNEKFGDTNVVANLDSGNSLEVKIFQDGYDQRDGFNRIMDRPEIYVTHPENVRMLETKQEGFLTPSLVWKDLKKIEESSNFLRGIASFAMSFLPFDLEDLVKFSSRHGDKCKGLVSEIISSGKLEGNSFKKIPKYSEGMNISAIKYQIPFEKGDYRKISVLIGVDDACFSFKFLLNEENKTKNNSVVQNPTRTDMDYDRDWTPTDGNIFVYTSSSNPDEISVCDFGKREKRILRKTPNLIEHSPTLSPDGKRIAFMGSYVENDRVAGRALFTSDLQGNYKKIMDVSKNFVGLPAWEGNENLVHYVLNLNRDPNDSQGFDLYRINVNSGEYKKIGKSGGFYTQEYVISIHRKLNEEQKRWCLGNDSVIIG